MSTIRAGAWRYRPLVLAAAVAVGSSGCAAAGTAGQPSDLGTLTGTIEVSGGPAPGKPRPVAGVIVLHPASGPAKAVQATAKGLFAVTLPAGTYRVTGRSSAVVGMGVDCLPLRPSVTVTAGACSRVAVYCNVP